MAMLRFMDDNMDANMNDNRVPADQSQALPSARPITERLNFAITGSGEWSAENLFIFPENVTHPDLTPNDKKPNNNNLTTKCIMRKFVYFLV